MQTTLLETPKSKLVIPAVVLLIVGIVATVALATASSVTPVVNDPEDA